jgi:uroporphyrinogen III methyltransferase/synthase
VRNLAALAKRASLDLRQRLEDKTVACIGPITAGTAQDLGLSVHIVAAKYTIEGLVEALIQHFSGKDIPEK